MGGGSRVMYCKLTEQRMLRIFFSIFFCEELHKPVSQNLRGALSMGGSWLEVYVTHHPPIIFVGCGDYPEFCFKELRFGVHADSVVLVNFLHVLGSIKGEFISSLNAFKQTLGLFCRNYSFVNPSQDVLRLYSGACLSIRVDKVV